MRPLPATKLSAPRAGATPVPRPRLAADLSASRRETRTTLVVAPAGYGKTTLVAAWVATLETRAAWFCLDPGDDPGSVSEREADHVVGGWLAAALEAAAALPRAPAQPGLLALAAALQEASWRGVLVVDDAHHLGPAAGSALTTWVERAPDGVHTVLLARSAPPVPVARWLARGDAELLQTDALRMTPDESRALLARTVPDLPTELADALTERVEGWPAGLHLASRSLRGRADPEDVIGRFTGTDRYVLAFLTEEVLLRLPDDLHEATLLLAGEPRLCAGLVNALTQRSDGAALLARLEAHEAFLERLDDVHDADTPWFRFPGFFRDLLAHRLALVRPDLPPALRARAELWWRSRAATAQPATMRAATATAATTHADSSASAGGSAGPAVAVAPATRATDGPPEELTVREREVLALLVGGATTKAAARTLGVSPNTIKTHTRHLFEKLGVGDRREAARRARELGLVEAG